MFVAYITLCRRYSNVGDIMPEKLFSASGLIRSRLSPDGTKLVMSTSFGCLIVVHDLDIGGLYKDLRGFKPRMFRLKYRETFRGDQLIFTRRKNRVELIADFPTGNDAGLISSLEVGPRRKFLHRTITFV